MTSDMCAQALRDFFFSIHGDEMAAAVRILEESSGVPGPEVADWEAVEFDFNRLFVGPRAPMAPPFASVYLESEPRLMGQSTLTVRNAYLLLGLASPDKNSLPDDHVALELDACLVMRALLRGADNEDLEGLWRFFIKDHMGKWVPDFAASIRKAPDVHPVFVYVADHLERWVEDRNRMFATAPDPLGQRQPGGRHENVE